MIRRPISRWPAPRCGHDVPALRKTRARSGPPVLGRAPGRASLSSPGNHWRFAEVDELRAASARSGPKKDAKIQWRTMKRVPMIQWRTMKEGSRDDRLARRGAGRLRPLGRPGRRQSSIVLANTIIFVMRPFLKNDTGFYKTMSKLVPSATPKTTRNLKKLIFTTCENYHFFCCSFCHEFVGK